MKNTLTNRALFFQNWKEGGIEVNLEENEYDMLCSLDTFKFTLFTEQLPRQAEHSRQRSARLIRVDLINLREKQDVLVAF